MAEKTILPQEVLDELAVVIRQFTESPPFLLNESEQRRFGEALKEQMAMSMVCTPLFIEIYRDWIALVGKVMSTYAVLGVQVKPPDPPSKFFAKLGEK